MDLRPSPPSALQMKSEAVHHVDYAVVGCGVAGLRGAIELCAAGSVLVLAKSDLSDSATNWAQGGIAAALSDDDEVSLHEQDTIQAGDGLCRPEAVKILVEEGPEYIQQLIEWGTQFDRGGAQPLPDSPRPGRFHGARNRAGASGPRANRKGHSYSPLRIHHRTSG